MSYTLNLKGIKTAEIEDGGEARRQAIDIIDSFLECDEKYFDVFYERWFNPTETSVFTRENVKKMFNPLGYMNKIINELVLLSPNMDKFNTSVKYKLKILNDFLKKINWDALLPQIIKTQETKGDFFLTWFYDENDEIYIRVLNSKDIVDVAMNPSRTEPISYSHKKVYVKEEMDDVTGEIISRETYEVTTIFAKGYIKVNDPIKYPNGYKIFENKKWEKDKIRLIHIPSIKNINKKFSKIPAVDYIDSILLLDVINTDLRLINKLLGFPIKFLIDGKVDMDSLWGVGGLVSIKSDTHNNQAKLLSSEVNHDLATIMNERDLINKDLFKKVGLIREELEEKITSGGNSRVLAQLRLTLENKFKKYYKNIANAFAPLFESVLRSKGAWNEKKDSFITFELPDLFVNTSIFDELQIINSKMALGQTTIQEELRNKGFDEERINIFKKEINEEQVLGNSDVEIKKEVISEAVNGQSSLSDTTDNQFKQKHNIKR